MVPWWGTLLFLMTGFLIGLLAGRALGVSQAGNQLMQALTQKQPGGMPDMGGIFNRGSQHGEERGAPRT